MITKNLKLEIMMVESICDEYELTFNASANELGEIHKYNLEETLCKGKFNDLPRGIQCNYDYENQDDSEMIKVMENAFLDVVIETEDDGEFREITFSIEKGDK